MLNNSEQEENNEKLKIYNKYITKLESLFKSTIIKGQYEGYRLIPSLMLFNFINLLRGVAVLDYNHMLESGNIVIRSMFEVLIDFLYCETDRKLYLRFGEYLYVEKILFYKNISSNIKNQISEEDFSDEILKKMNRKYNLDELLFNLKKWFNKMFL